MALKRKTGDFSPWVAVLRPRRKSPTNLTGATVTLVMTDRSGNLILDHVAVEVDADQVANRGRVTYYPDPNAPITPGAYRLEFEVDFGDGFVEKYPSRRFEAIRILEDLG